MPLPELDDPAFIVTMATVCAGPDVTELLFLGCYAWGELDFRRSLVYLRAPALRPGELRWVELDSRVKLLQHLHGDIQRHNDEHATA